MDEEDEIFREVVDNLEPGPKQRSKSEKPTIGSLQEQVEVLKDQLQKSENQVESLLAELKRA